MIKEIVLDTTELEAPEPMTVVLNNLSKLDELTSIKMIHRIEPQMLFPILDKNNLHYKIVPKNDDVIIYIWNNNFKDKAQFTDLN